MKMNVLASPAHYIINESMGGETYISYKILDELSSNYNVNYDAIVGYNRIKKDKYGFNIIELYPGKSIKLGNIVKLQFYYDCFRKSSELIRKKDFDLIHHILPWRYEQTFNLLVLFNYAKDIPFVTGPVMNPQVFMGDDEQASGKFVDTIPPRQLIGLQKYGPQLFSHVLRRLFAKTVKRADRIIAVNEYTKELYSKYVDGRKIVVIPFGIDTCRFGYKFAENERPVIVFAGFLVERKGVGYLIQAFKKVLADIPQAKLKIFGKGRQKKKLMKLSKDLGIEGNVKFEGFISREELREEYRSADIFVLPTLSESFGMVLIEAMASGTPCIASDIIGPNEIIEHGKTGYLFPKTDVSALANYISKIVKNHGLRRMMSKKARKRAEEKYDWNVVAKQYYEIYQEVLNK